MLEVIYFPRHGDKRGGTGYSCYGGFGYGAGYGDAVTLKADRPTDLFAPNLTTKVERAKPVTAKEEITHANRVRPTASQPPTVAVTRGGTAKSNAKANGADRAAHARAGQQADRIRAAIKAGKLSPQAAKAKAEQVANHGLNMRLAAHEAYNAIAIIEARLRTAKAAGKSTAAHHRVLARMRLAADRLHAIAARDTAMAAAARDASWGLSGYNGFITFNGFGDVENADARAIESEAAGLIAQAGDELAADNPAAAATTIANAEGTFRAANSQMSAEQAAGDVFAQVSAALDPSTIPWGKVGAVVLIIAALNQVTR